MKLPQLSYCDCIYVGLLLHSFIVLTSSLKWTKLRSSYNLFRILRIRYLGNFRREKVTKIFKKNESKKVIFPSGFIKLDWSSFNVWGTFNFSISSPTRFINLLLAIWSSLSSRANVIMLDLFNICHIVIFSTLCHILNTDTGFLPSFTKNVCYFDLEMMKEPSLDPFLNDLT